MAAALQLIVSNWSEEDDKGVALAEAELAEMFGDTLEHMTLDQLARALDPADSDLN